MSRLLWLFLFDLLNKQSLKLVLSELFNVKIVSINSYILPGKKCRLGKFSGYKNSYKRIFVVLVWLHICYVHNTTSFKTSFRFIEILLFFANLKGFFNFIQAGMTIPFFSGL